MWWTVIGKWKYERNNKIKLKRTNCTEKTVFAFLEPNKILDWKKFFDIRLKFHSQYYIALWYGEYHRKTKINNRIIKKRH